jgi:hypothetical protein
LYRDRECNCDAVATYSAGPGDPTAPPSSGAHSISSDGCVGGNVASTHGRPGLAGNKDGVPAAAVGNATKNNAKKKISTLLLKPPLDRSSNKYSNLEFFRMILSHTKVEVIKAFMLPSINLKGQYCTGGCQTTTLFVF